MFTRELTSHIFCYMFCIYFCVNIFSMACTNSITCSGSIRIPLNSFTKSSGPPFCTAITGLPQAMASIYTTPNVSYLLGSTKQSHCCILSTTSSRLRLPMNSTLSVYHISDTILQLYAVPVHLRQSQADILDSSGVVPSRLSAEYQFLFYIAALLPAYSKL